MESVQIVQLIYERGIVVRKFDSEWHLLNLLGGKTVQIDRPRVVADAYAVRPIIFTERFDSGHEREWLLRNDLRNSFAIQISELDQAADQKKQPLFTMLNIIYLLQSVEYHCFNLCKAYAAICEKFSMLPGISDGDVALFQGQAEPYFEFDALITAVRRAYDSCRYLLWNNFGPGKGGIQSSFYKTLPLCKARIPRNVSERLETSWSTFGEKLSAYRHCIQHYTPVDFGSTSVHIKRLDRGAFTVSALIPDNPSVRSRKNFTFSERRDALTYGWELANEILTVATLIVGTVSMPS